LLVAVKGGGVNSAVTRFEGTLQKIGRDIVAEFINTKA
jgi:hypothetical protein